jgi:hypothetical protein
MDTARIVVGLHLVVAAIFLLFGVYAGLSGNPIQLVAMSSIAVMIGLLGRYTGRAAARR